MKFKRILSLLLCATMLMGALVALPLFGASAAVGAATVTQNTKVVDVDAKNETATTFASTVLATQSGASYTQAGGGPSTISNGVYKLIGFTHLYYKATGAYSYSIDFNSAVSGSEGFRHMFIRGIENASWDGGYFGGDGHDADTTSSGTAGIYMIPVVKGNKTQLRVNVKQFESDAVNTSVSSIDVTYFDINSTKITVYDNGIHINVFAGDEFVVGFAVSGNRGSGNFTFTKGNGSKATVAKSQFAGSVTMIYADGTTRAIENPLIAAGASTGHLGLATRASEVHFKSLKLKAMEDGDVVNKNIIKSNLAEETPGAKLENSNLAAQFGGTGDGYNAGGTTFANTLCVVATNGEYYNLSFGSVYAKTTGPYTYSVNFQTPMDSGNPANWSAMTVRGDLTCDFGDGGFHGANGNNAGALGCAGINILPIKESDGTVRLRVEFPTYDNSVAPMWERIDDGNKVGDYSKATMVRKYFAINSLDITVLDDGTNVYIYAGDELIVTIVINGTKTFNIKSYSYDSFVGANSVNMIYPNGKIETIANAVVAPTCISQVALAVRSGHQLRFTSVELGAFDPAPFGAPQFMATAQQLMDLEGHKSTGTETPALNKNAGYVTLTSGGTANGSDPNVYALHNTGHSVATGKYVAIKYRTTTNSGLQLFMGAGASPVGGSAKGYIYGQQDGNWALAIVDISSGMGDYKTSDRTNYIRFDFLQDGLAGCSVDVAYLAIFASEADALAYEAKRSAVAIIDKTIVHDAFGSATAESTLGDASDYVFDNASATIEEPTFAYHQNKVSYTGWIAANGKLGLFGYQIDNNTPVYDAAFTRDNTQNPTDASAITIDAQGRGADFGQRYDFKNIDLSAYNGTHTLTFLYKPDGAAEGGVLNTYTYTLVRPTAAADETAVFVGNGINVTTSGFEGQWIGLYEKDADPTAAGTEAVATWAINGEAVIDITAAGTLAAGVYDLIVFGGSETTTVVERITVTIKEKATLGGSSASVGADIGVNLYMELSPDVAADADAYMEFQLPNGTTETVKVPANTTEEGGTSYYVFSSNVAVKELASEIVATIISPATGVEISYTYTVKEYAEKIVAGEYAEADKELAKALLNYGAAAQTKFEVEGPAANEKLEEADKALDAVPAEDIAQYAATSEGSVTGVTVVGTTTVLEANTAIRFYFAAESFEGITITVNGTEVTPAPGTGKYAAYSYIAITDITASEMDTTYEVVLTNGAETQTIGYSVFSYIYTILNGTDADGNAFSDESKAVVTAAYWYCQAANDCVAQ